jgi:hypothetical protein
VVDLEPTEAAACITQHQVSNTGMLLSTDFEVQHPMVIEPLALPKGEWVRLDNTADTGLMTLSLAGMRYGGTFFQSRSLQGQLLRAMLPTRARLELKNGLASDAAPELVSTLTCGLDEVYYCDSQRRLWKSQGKLSTGQTAVLIPTNLTELRLRMKDIASQTGHTETWDEALRRFQNLRPGSFIATSSAPGKDLMLESLPSIRWQQDCALFIGAVAQP